MAPIRNHLFLRFFLPALFLAFSLLGRAGTGGTPPPPDGTWDSQALEKKTFLLINQYRKDHDLPALQWDDGIAKTARGHSRDMASGDVDFGHDGFTKRVNQLKSAMAGLHGAGENVFRSNDPDEVAKSAVASWLESPHHLENIRGNYNYSGLGIARDDKGMIYFTQIFVKTVPPVPVAQAAQAQSPPGLLTPLGVVDLPMPPRPTR